MKAKADICLLLEGTFPYVRGGVSSWLNDLILGLPDYRFYIIFIGGSADTYKKYAYELPKNVVGIEEHYLINKVRKSKPKARRGKNAAFDAWSEFASYFEQGDKPIPGDLLKQVTELLGDKKSLPVEDFLYSEASWEVLTERYCESAFNHSFVDFFWTYRNIFQPLFTLAKIARNLPEAKVYHSISTGYAGFLGALCRQQTQQPYLLSEHGIYTKERNIDLAQADWIKDKRSAIDLSMHKGDDVIRQTWMQFFAQLGLTAYDQAQRIVSLFEANRQRQHQDGASESKTQVIVNGIDTKRFLVAYEQRPKHAPMVAGLVGRVVPIKDIKTFIRSIQAASMQLPELEGWIVGPAEEDPAYAEECRNLIASFGMQNKILMLGNQDVAKILPQLGVMVLTSISEAQPLVLLEAMAAGVPCVATDVGACREILEGREGEDAALGCAGQVVPIANPSKVAKAIAQILCDSEHWQQSGDVGRTRVLKYYDRELMFQSYRNLYKEAIDGGYRL